MSPHKDRSTSVLVTTSIASFLTPFMSSATTVALPAMGRRFELDAVALSWVATSYILAAAVFLVPFGRIADLRGRKAVFAAGVLVFTIGSALSGLAPSFLLLLAARVVQGIGGAMTFGTSTALLVAAFPLERRGHALGINVATVYAGLALGPVLGGVMTQYLGWRAVFWALAPLGLLAFVLSLTGLDADKPAKERQQFDWPGSIIYGVALLALMYGFSILPRGPGFVLAGAGAAGIVLFGLVELRRPSPVLDIRLFRHNQVFAFSSIAAMVNYAATAAVAFLLSLYLQFVRGFAPQQAGLVLVAAPVMQAVFSPIAGRLSDRVEPRVVASLGMALTAAGLLVLLFLGRATPTAMVVASLLLVGTGFGLFSSPNTNAIMCSVEQRDYGLAGSVVATVRMIGQMLSMGIVMMLFSVRLGTAMVGAADPTALLGGIRVAFGLFAALCLAGVFASLARGRVRPGQPAPECAR